MLREDDRIRMQHMLEAAREAQKFIRGRDLPSLREDRMLGFAVMHALEIIGEAAQNISESGRALLPALPWPKIVGMRNRLIHAYFDVNYAIVWDTIQDALPPLIAELERILAQE